MKSLSSHQESELGVPGVVTSIRFPALSIWISSLSHKVGFQNVWWNASLMRSSFCSVHFFLGGSVGSELSKGLGNVVKAGCHIG